MSEIKGVINPETSRIACLNNITTVRETSSSLFSVVIFIDSVGFPFGGLPRNPFEYRFEANRQKTPRTADR